MQSGTCIQFLILTNVGITMSAKRHAAELVRDAKPSLLHPNTPEYLTLPTLAHWFHR